MKIKKKLYVHLNNIYAFVKSIHVHIDNLYAFL
jgi:hypothetical protein